MRDTDATQKIWLFISSFPPYHSLPKGFFLTQLSNQSLDVFVTSGVIKKRNNTRRRRRYQDLKQKGRELRTSNAERWKQTLRLGLEEAILDFGMGEKWDFVIVALYGRLGERERNWAQPQMGQQGEMSCHGRKRLECRKSHKSPQMTRGDKGPQVKTPEKEPKTSMIPRQPLFHPWLAYQDRIQILSTGGSWPVNAREKGPRASE